jgi:hypothetical protein
LALANFEAVFGLYALQKFHHGPKQVGVILAVVGLVSAVGRCSLAHYAALGRCVGHQGFAVHRLD